jgi:MFS family permease
VWCAAAVRQLFADRAWYYTQLQVYEAKAISTSVKNAGSEKNTDDSADAKLPRVKVSLNAVERRIVAALAGIYATRMLGLFLPLTVLSLYVSHLPGATPVQVGWAMGTYALVQTLFQIPFGRWSDRYGRRPMIAIGLLLFLLGSVLGVFATTLGWVIAARAMQGAGSMSAAVTALLADHTRDEVRTRAMAFIGISIGASFVLSLIIAPVLDSAIGMQGVFGVMGLMAILGLGLLRWGAPGELASADRKSAVRTSLWRVACLPQLRGHFVGVFALHFILSGTFLSVPQVLVNVLGIPKGQHWQIYSGVFLISLLGTVILIRIVERASQPARVTVAAILIAALSQGLMALLDARLWLMLLVFAMYFAAFNFLEARLPAALSKAAPGSDRGAALGVFGTCQSLGSACGPVAGGLVAARFGYGSVFWLSSLVALGWALVVAMSAAES